MKTGSMLCAQDGVKIMNKLRLSEIAPRIIEILLEGCGYSRKVVKWNLPLLICTLRVRRHRTKQEATRQRSHLELSSKMQGAPYCCLGWRYTVQEHFLRQDHTKIYTIISTLLLIYRITFVMHHMLVHAERQNACVQFTAHSKLRNRYVSWQDSHILYVNCMGIPKDLWCN